MEQLNKINELFGLITELNDMEEFFRVNEKYVSAWDMGHITSAIGRMRRKIHKEAREDLKANKVDAWDVLMNHIAGNNNMDEFFKMDPTYMTSTTALNDAITRVTSSTVNKDDENNLDNTNH